jgi:hypothetical protein
MVLNASLKEKQLLTVGFDRLFELHGHLLKG